MEAVDAARRLKPDVVLMDIRMPGLDGIEATRRVLAGAGDGGVRVLMLTTFDLNEYVYDALRAGASGLPAQGRAAGAARRRASGWWRGGDALLAPSITRRLIQEFAQAGPAQRAAAEGPGRADRARARGVQARSRAASRTRRSPPS